VFVVCTSIPLAIFCSIVGLMATGNSINIMTLGGLSLAIGMLVDDATVEVENIHRNRSLGYPLTVSILRGAQQIALPAIMATLAICIVFLPVVLLTVRQIPFSRWPKPSCSRCWPLTSYRERSYRCFQECCSPGNARLAPRAADDTTATIDPPSPRSRGKLAKFHAWREATFSPARIAGYHAWREGIFDRLQTRYTSILEVALKYRQFTMTVFSAAAVVSLFLYF